VTFFIYNYEHEQCVSHIDFIFQILHLGIYPFYKVQLIFLNKFKL
jgi:hypothetical protein